MNSAVDLITKALMLIAMSLTLSGCMGDQCIDADDFGFPRYTISSRYNPSEIVGTGENEVGPWRDNKITLNGNPLTIVVKNWNYTTDNNDVGTVSAWSPWYGSSSDGDTAGSYFNLVNGRFIECTWSGNAAGGFGLYSNPATRYAMITNAPCMLHKGVGLYALIANKGTNPNSVITSDPPQGITFHVGNPAWQNQGIQPWQVGTNQIGTSYSLFDVTSKGTIEPAGGLVCKYDSTDNTTYAGNTLYFKILDRMHGDNSGQYRIIIKSGINDPYPDPFQYITALVKNQFFGDPSNANNTTGVIKNIYLQIIGNNSYKVFVGALLTLYVMFTAFSFLIGMLQITQTEFLIRILKVGIVAALLDQNYGWTFFYNYLFVFFIDGTSELINIIQQAANTGGGSSSLLTMLIAPETIGKVLSLLLTSPTGIIYIIVYIVLLVFFVFISFRAASLYISALIMIGMIIIMGPIFLCFMLFGFTKSLYENWIKQLMYYTLQPIILITSIAFMSMMIRHEIYSTLGFRICRYDFPDLGPLFSLVNPSDSSGTGTPKSLFFWFFPSPMVGTDFSDQKAVIPVPEAHNQLNPDGTKNGVQCAAYECNESRYVDLPFLDPYNPRDMARRDNFRTGTFTQFENLIYLAVLIYLMYKFNESAITISRALNNTSVNSARPEGAAQAASGNISNIVKSKTQEFVHKKSAPLRAAFRELAFKAENATVGRAARKYESAMIGMVSKDALGKGAHQSVLDQVKQKHNLDRNELNLTAKEDYQKALATKLSETSNGKLNFEQANKELSNLQLRQNKYLQDIPGDDKNALKKAELKSNEELAALFNKYGKEQKSYKEIMEQKISDSALKGANLSAAQRAKLDDMTLSALSKDADLIEKFRKAYVNEYLQMSKEGYGFFGKRSGAFRKYVDYKKNLDQRGEGFFHKDSFFGDSRQKARGDSLHSGYDSLKYALSGGLLKGDTMQYNFSNPRMQTYQEELIEKNLVAKQKDLQKTIDTETTIRGRNILRPEYLATLSPEVKAKYEKLRDQQIEYDVYNTLKSDPGGDKDSPVLMGDRYMREKMTDKQFRAAIDRAALLENEHIENDKYLKNIEYKDKDDKASKAMQQREDKIRAEFKKNIDLLNQYRVKAGMPVYNPKK